MSWSKKVLRRLRCLKEGLYFWVVTALIAAVKVMRTHITLPKVLDEFPERMELKLEIVRAEVAHGVEQTLAQVFRIASAEGIVVHGIPCIDPEKIEEHRKNIEYLKKCYAEKKYWVISHINSADTVEDLLER